ncbi:MAG: acyl-CoA dehydrogenase family protein [Deltaproteobacteria bacterium]
MDFKFSEEEEAFRTEVQAFLDENLPTDAKKSDPAFIAEWDRKVRAKGWVGYTWPKEVGGGGGTIAKQVILKEEMSARRAPMLGSCFMGLAWVGPGIIQYGTDEQKKRFIPDILDSKYQWCTGYSEPNVGSDLASLQCRGVRDGDEYVVNGQKIWTSGAAWSKWMILLVRTDPDSRVKHDGITCLLVPMDSPGVEVRAIQNMAGYSMFSEVFFNDVRVPVTNRLGEEGQGWRVTISALANERSGIAEVTQMIRKLGELKSLAKRSRHGGRPALEDSGIRRGLARFEARIEAMRLNGLRYLTKQLKGEKLSSETSVNKLHRANLEIEMGDFALDLLGGASGYFPASEAAPDGGKWPFRALNWPEVVIGGGTPNIQKNIISERILGLPKD